MTSEEMKARTEAFALAVIGFVQALPNNLVSAVLGRQLLRAGTGIGSNYRASCRARSRADFVAKMKVVEEEADESVYWLSLIVRGRIVTTARADDLIDEASQLLAIAVSSIKTARENDRKAVSQYNSRRIR